MPPPPRRPGSVAVESPASGPLHMLQSELLSAKAAWEQLGVRIAKGYTTAYGKHVQTLAAVKRKRDNMEASKEATADGLIFVFSIVTVGLAGGIVGGLMGPWIKKQSESTAHFVFKEAIRGLAQQAAKDLTKAGDEKLKKLASVATDDPYTTNSPKEIAVDQDIRDRIGSAFGPVLEGIDAMIDEANRVGARAAAGQDILNNFRQACPLITDKPAQDDIPSEHTVATAAELAIWVVWANERDWNQWTPRYNAMDAAARQTVVNGRLAYPKDKGFFENAFVFANSEIEDALVISPIDDRLLELGKWQDVKNTSIIIFGPRKDVTTVTYTDLRKLKALVLNDSSLPFRKMSGLSFQWDKTNPLQRVKFLSSLTGVKPLYK